MDQKSIRPEQQDLIKGLAAGKPGDVMDGASKEAREGLDEAGFTVEPADDATDG